MGMAASQARLLSLTARLHDIEYKAQNVMAQKLALATQKDGLYQEYCEALDKTAFKVAYRDYNDASTTLVDANFSSVCTYNDRRCQQLYALRDNSTGKILVTQEVADNYKQYGQDKYAFAYAMLGMDTNFNWTESGYDPNETALDVGVIGKAQNNDEDMGYVTEKDGTYSLYMTQCEQLVYNENSTNDPDLEEKYEKISNSDGVAKQKALDEFRDYLYSEYAEDIYDYMNINKNDTLEASLGADGELAFPDQTWDDIAQEFNYYVKMWSAINEAGGCQTIDPKNESGEQGNTWFKSMVESGLVSILAYDLNGRDKEWSETSFATSTNKNYLQEVQDDSEAKKAETKYEHELDVINRKDTKFDNELNKLETERTAITTEMDSIKKVEQDNIERTFKLFS